jgi:hypothetical protein
MTSLLLGQVGIAKNCQHVAIKPYKPCPPWRQKGWAATLYSGPLTSQTSTKILVDPDFGNSGIIAFAGSKQLASIWEKKLDFEFEMQAVQHFGAQKHFEFNPIVLIARWKDFPWNASLPTTLAIGDGLSIATEIPKLEEKKRGRKNCNKVLNFVMAEFTLSLPNRPQWAFVVRYHHRSGMFGVFHGIHDASTAFALGIKYWF